MGKIKKLKKKRALNFLLLQTMRILVILFTCIGSTFAGSSYSQETKISLDMKDVTLETLFSEIEKSTSYIFMYKENVNIRKKVNVQVNNETLGQILDKLFTSHELGYKINDRQVTVFKKEKAESLQPGKSQQKEGTKIVGSVIDVDGEPMTGASVSVRGTTIGTVTDLNGEFAISVSSDTSTIVVSMIGYIPQTIKIGKQRILSIKMLEDDNVLEEVTVVAFGRQKKESIVSAITTISPSELKAPSSNLTTALQGRMAGVISYQRSGEPGSDNAEFFLRGVTTFGFNSSPLILIDNIELTTTDLARLQADDIESFSIMKDATATALYGSRAANGVVFVKTKEGKKGSARFNLRFETGLSQPTQEIKLADPVTYMKLHNEAYLTRDPLSSELPYSLDKIDNTIPGSNSLIYPATDWKKEMLNNHAITERINLNISGGGDIARYYVAASYSNDDGILKNNPENDFNTGVSFKTYTLRSNVNINVTKTTELLVRLNGNFEDYSGPIGSKDGTVRGGTHVYNLIMKSNPVRFPAKYTIGDPNNKVVTDYIRHTMFGNDATGTYLNPYAEMVRGYQDYGRANLGAQLELKQDFEFITSGLSGRMLFNTNRISSYTMNRTLVPYYYSLVDYNRYTGEYATECVNPDGTRSGTEYLTFDPGTKSIATSTYFEAAVDYIRSFNKHNLSGMLVLQIQDNAQPNAATLEESLPYRNVGLSGRFTYGYDSRYFMEANFGYNGSERFDEKHRWGFFPSMGAGWVISNESFFEPLLTSIDKLKIRASYGLVGNDKIGVGRFLYLSEVNMNNGSYSSSFGLNNDYKKNGISISRYANSDITWETATKANLALEIDVMNSISMIAEVYTEHRKNILQQRTSIPASMGLWSSPWANIGEAKGSGFDLSLDYNKYFKKDLWMQLRANFTYATSEYSQYEELKYPNAPWKSHIGYPTTQQWGYIAEGLFVDDAEVANSPKQFGSYSAGDIKYRDLNGDGIIDSQDMAPIGYPTTPEIVYGFGGSFGYKQFDFSIFFQGTARESFWINYNTVSPFFNTSVNSANDLKVTGENALAQFIVDSHWSEESRNAYAVWPRLSASSISNNAVKNTWFMRDGSFLRLKQLEFGYTFPEKSIQKIGLKSLRVYFTGSNLICFSNFKLWDPEMAGNGLGYPIQRVYNVGLNLNF